MWHVMRSELILDNRWAKVRKDHCVLPNGKEVDDYFYWEGGDYVQIFAITDDEKIVLTRQYKHGVKEMVIELPAGLIESTDEQPMKAAIRELVEETGYTAQNWYNLGVLNVSSAKSTARCHAFFAENAVKSGTVNFDPNEEIEVELWSLTSFVDGIVQGHIKDIGTAAICLLGLKQIGKIP